MSGALQKSQVHTKKSNGSSGCRFENNIKMNLNKIVWRLWKKIHFAEDRVQF
jgi:hypothetical protein